jgi:hypothetical protein
LKYDRPGDLAQPFEKRFTLQTVLKLNDVARRCYAPYYEEHSFASEDPAAVRTALDPWLRQHPQLGQATFVVDVLPAGASLTDDKERLLALNRFRQMHQARAVVPAPNASPVPAGEWPYCGIDFVRPATCHNHARNDDKRRVSESVHVRADYGRDRKQRSYEELLKDVGWSLTPLRKHPEADEVLFARHFHEIGTRGRHQVGDDKAVSPNLNDKIAVIYIDGNRFGKTQGDLRRTQVTYASAEELQRAWDHHIQDELRKPALKAVLDRANEDDGWLCRPDPQGKPKTFVVRFETLLWGGDELTWVVPAWKGWEAVGLFFDAVARAYGERVAGKGPAARPAAPPARGVRNLNAPRPKPPAAPPQRPWGRLTHAAGLVFCHADSPIHRITALARELAEAAKKAVAHKEDALAYVVLESFDQLGQDLEQARAAHLPAGCDPASLVVRGGDELRDLTRDLQVMIGGFPHGSVYRILRALRGADAEDFRFWLERAARDFGGVPARFVAARTEQGRLAAGLPAPAGRAAWLHLAELWDYLPPATPTGGRRR